MALSSKDKGKCKDWAIILDSGHGVSTGGKRSPTAFKKTKADVGGDDANPNDPTYLREYAWTRKEVDFLKNALEFLGFTVHTINGDIDGDTPLKIRAKDANDFIAGTNKKCLSMSIHVNAAGSGDRWLSASGWTVCIQTTKSQNGTTYIPKPGGKEGMKNLEEARRLSECMYEIAVALRQKGNRTSGINDRQNLAMTRMIDCPAILTENLFQDNVADTIFLNSPEGIKTMAEIHIAGILKYIGATTYTLRENREIRDGKYTVKDSRELAGLGFIEYTDPKYNNGITDFNSLYKDIELRNSLEFPDSDPSIDIPSDRYELPDEREMESILKSWEKSNPKKSAEGELRQLLKTNSVEDSIETMKQGAGIITPENIPTPTPGDQSNFVAKSRGYYYSFFR